MANSTIITASDLNVLHHYHIYINEYLIDNKHGIRYTEPINNNITTPSAYCEFLNNWINKLFNKSKIYSLDLFIPEMIKSIQQDCSIYNWLNNDRICYFTWLFLIYGDYEIFKKNSDRRARFEIRDNFGEIILSSQERNSIVRKLIPFVSDRYELKIKELTNSIKKNWAIVESFRSPFSLLEKEKSEELIKWTWNYILGRINNDFEQRSRKILRSFAPTTLNEKYLAIFAIHDYYYTSDKNLHKVFCSEYKRALSQKKFREKENIKTINFQVGTEYKQKLDDLLYYYQYSQQRFFEMLIKEHYNSVKDSLDKMQRK